MRRGEKKTHEKRSDMSRDKRAEKRRDMREEKKDKRAP